MQLDNSGASNELKTGKHHKKMVNFHRGARKRHFRTGRSKTDFFQFIAHPMWNDLKITCHSCNFALRGPKTKNFHISFRQNPHGDQKSVARNSNFREI